MEPRSKAGQIEIVAGVMFSGGEIMHLARPDTEVVAIDEAQFLDEGMLEVSTALAARGVRVILAGTDTDFRGEPFGAILNSWQWRSSWTNFTLSAWCAATTPAATSV